MKIQREMIKTDYMAPFNFNGDQVNFYFPKNGKPFIQICDMAKIIEVSEMDCYCRGNQSKMVNLNGDFSIDYVGAEYIVSLFNDLKANGCNYGNETMEKLLRLKDLIMVL